MKAFLGMGLLGSNFVRAMINRGEEASFGFQDEEMQFNEIYINSRCTSLYLFKIFAQTFE